jgi:hypothetical protein
MPDRNDLQNANLELLIQIDRLLTEADKMRALRDRLLEIARRMPDTIPPPPKPAPGE